MCSECVMCCSFCSVFCRFCCSGELDDSVLLVVFSVLWVFLSVFLNFGSILLLICLRVLLRLVSELFRCMLMVLNGILWILLMILVNCFCSLLKLFGVVGIFSGLVVVLKFVLGVLGRKFIVMQSWLVSRLLVCVCVCRLWLISLLIIGVRLLFLLCVCDSVVSLLQVWLSCCGQIIVLIVIGKCLCFLL